MASPECGLVRPANEPAIDCSGESGYTGGMNTASSSTTLKEFITAAEAAKLLGNTPQGVSHLCRRGYFPGTLTPFGTGRGYLIPRREVLAFAKKRASGLITKGGRPRKDKPDNDLRRPKNIEKSIPKRR